MSELIREVQTFKTPYEWCLEHKVRPYEPENWTPLPSQAFHLDEMSEIEFLKRLGEVKFNKNSIHVRWMSS